MILLGSGFSPTFNDVILVLDAVILPLILIAAYFDEIASSVSTRGRSKPPMDSNSQ